MSAIIDGLISGEILYLDVIKWLTSINKEDGCEKLPASVIKKQEFVIYLLNSIRELSAKGNVQNHIVQQQESNLSVQNDKTSETTDRVDIGVQGATGENFNKSGEQIKNDPISGRLCQLPAKNNLTPRSNKQSPTKFALHITIQRPFHTKPHKNNKISNATVLAQRRNKTLATEVGPSRPGLNISDPSEFPSVGEAAVRNKRITPTRVPTKSGDANNVAFQTRPTLQTLQQKENAPLQTNPIFSGTNPNFITPILEDSKVQNFDHERELLRKERAKCEMVLPIAECFDNSICVESATLPHFVTWSPSFEEVANRELLDCLVHIYDCIFRENYVPNVVSEIYCILSLLNYKIPKYSCSNPDEGINFLFENGHNCVYFAAHVLLKLRRVISLLDKSTMGLLCNNSRIEAFCPELHYYLNNIYQTLLPLELLDSNGGNVIETVAFAANTDARDNFVSESEFSAFRKQRDTFYELLRQWEANHQASTWSMKAAQCSHIKILVNLSKHPFTCTHFARLFVSQLIIVSSGESKQIEDDIPPAEVLSLLQKTNPDKYLRLLKRLVRSSDSRGPCPKPCFPHSQEFFKDFIILASSPIFNQHLTDCLTTKIFELDEKYSPDLHGVDGDAAIKNDCRAHFLACVATLRIMAKFLGFVTFLPYKCDSVLPQPFITAQVALRKMSLPPVDFITLLKSGKLITLVWIVDFFAMMDGCSMQLVCYKRVFTMLWLYYRSPALMASTESLLTYRQLFLLSLLGWLFEVVNIPGSFSSVADDDEHVENTLHISAGDLEIIDQVVLYSCCPYWTELRILLSGFSQGSSVRKITPVSVSADKFGSKSSAEIQLQLKLEANFFNNNPPSVKKVVDFVADRLASNAIKDIFHKAITDARYNNVGVIKDSFDKHILSTEGLSEPSNAVEFPDDEIWSVISLCIVAADLYLKKKAYPALLHMLPEETTGAVLEMCSKILCRIAMGKISLWAGSDTAKRLFQDCFKELKKRLDMPQTKLHDLKCEETFTGESETGECCNDSLPCPTETVIRLKDMIYNALLRGMERSLQRKDIEAVILDIKILEQNRKDLSSQIPQLLIQLSVDLSITLVQFCPRMMDDAMQDMFMDLWKTVTDDYSHINRIVSAKTLLLLQMSKQPELSWKSWAALVTDLIKEQLLHPSKFCEQCLSIWQQEFHWQENTLMKFSSYILGIMSTNPYNSLVVDKTLHCLLSDTLCEYIQKSQ